MCKETTPMPLVCSYPCPVQAPPPAAGEETRAWLCTPPHYMAGRRQTPRSPPRPPGVSPGNQEASLGSTPPPQVVTGSLPDS